MKKLIALVAVALILGLGNAHAMSMYFDVTGLGFSGTTDNKTGTFDGLGLLIQTTSSGSIFSPIFSDIGHTRVNSLIASGSVTDLEGLGSTWELTGGWGDVAGTELMGQITSSTYIAAIKQSIDTYSYFGGTLNIYADKATKSLFGSSIGSGDDTGFMDGTLVATFDLTGGTGSLMYDDPFNNPLARSPLSGKVDLTFKASYLKSGFWRAADGTDLSSLLSLVPPLTVSLVTDSNTSTVIQTIGTDGSVTIDSDHDGSAYVAVPEPTSLVLLGLGLLGAAGLRKRKVM